ncbi:hypothetical protein MMC25_000104 [Agyrium rufum]|nr:hypothetical protein [Agyrium rufum]
MKDLYFVPPGLVGKLSQPLAEVLALKTLPLHIHEILHSFSIYHIINTYLAPELSTWLCPDVYSKLSERTKLNWNVRVVSTIQACFINSAALYVIFADEERWTMGWHERVWGYTGATGMVQGFAAGYFLWDLMISSTQLDVHGLGSLMHAASALTVSMMGFRPFVNYYGLNFILYELSTPFLNIHWFMDKFGMTGSRLQLVNGILLLISFAGCRLVWGTYQSVGMYKDVWAAIQTPAADLPVPAWLAVAYLVANSVLNILNFYWFGRMIQTLRSRFDEPKDAREERKEREKKGQ